MTAGGIAPHIEALADDAWLLRFAPGDDANARAHVLAARLRGEAPAWLRDLVPGWDSLGVCFDPAAVPADDVRAWLLAHRDHAPAAATASAPVVEIPVRYGGDHGIDLADAADALGLSPAQLIERHAAPLYTVAMIGFAPGFPYLAGLDPALALPRLATPRSRVPAGSVGIGGAQTGIYPRESPGGWRLLGRTPLRLFDPARASPSLLAPGDRVRFVAIDDAAFAALERGA
ncbi:MAG: 5-oxoprolinase subunit PxpB [Xanthomonadales bacterium]|nr:5-oxoprolinase subunit PxpB [Xanthomonadales bacterium]